MEREPNNKPQKAESPQTRPLRKGASIPLEPLRPGETLDDLDPVSRMEHIMGCRFEENDMNNVTTDGLTGQMARVMGRSEHDPKDDAVAGNALRNEARQRPRNDDAWSILAMALGNSK